MSPVAEGQDSQSTRFPRVSGDEPGLRLARDPMVAFSPRERG